MKFVLRISFLFIFPHFLYAQKSPNFSHPLQIEPVSIYNKIRVDGSYFDKRTNVIYEQNRNITIEGEYNFWNHFSISSSLGRNNYILTDTETSNTYDRFNLGVKYGRIIDFGTSSLLLGAGIRLYDKKKGATPTERENPDFYLVRPNFGIGFRSGRFEILSEFRFQTETNKSFKEGSLEEFRRYYQFGMAPSFAINQSLRTFMEFEYREPYDRYVDTKTRFFNFYPGVSFATENFGTFSLSLQIGLLKREENAIDRGIRFSYFYLFDLDHSNSKRIESSASKF